jgi:hypothetical protein
VSARGSPLSRAHGQDRQPEAARGALPLTHIGCVRDHGGSQRPGPRSAGPGGGAPAQYHPAGWRPEVRLGFAIVRDSARPCDGNLVTSPLEVGESLPNRMPGLRAPVLLVDTLGYRCQGIATRGGEAADRAGASSVPSSARGLWGDCKRRPRMTRGLSALLPGANARTRTGDLVITKPAPPSAPAWRPLEIQGLAAIAKRLQSSPSTSERPFELPLNSP